MFLFGKEFVFLLVSGQPGTLQELISRGCSTEDKEKNGATPLHLAAQASSVSSGQ